MKLLLVDDEQIALEELQDALMQIQPDAQVQCFDDGKTALEQAQKEIFDVAFLDIEMPELNGLELGRRLKVLQPKLNIVFVTAYSEYALDAFKLYASGYLLKPVQTSRVREALSNLRTPVVEQGDGLRVQCFGTFDVFYQGKPVQFGRSLAKELFAYLVDLKGASANTAQICSILWEDSDGAERRHHYFRNLVADLRKVLRRCGAADVLICQRNSFAINVEKLDCDYYKFLKNDITAINSYQGEYMSQYSWAEMTAGELKRGLR